MSFDTVSDQSIFVAEFNSSLKISGGFEPPCPSPATGLTIPLGQKKVLFTGIIKRLTSFVWLQGRAQIGVMNGPLKFLTAREILRLLDLLAKFKRVLACSCSQFLRCSQARKAIFYFCSCSQKKSQCSACSRMFAKTIRHPYKSANYPIHFERTQTRRKFSQR